MIPQPSHLHTSHAITELNGEVLLIVLYFDAILVIR